MDPSNPDAQLPITGVAERIVFLARPPQDIATSCWLRYSQPRDRTLASWARTVLFAERATRGMDRVVLEHAPLLADPALALRTLDPAASSYADEQLRLLRPELINCTKRGESFTSDDVDLVDFTPFELLCNEIFDALLALVPGIDTVSADDKTFDALYERYVDLRATGSDRVGVDVDALSAAVLAVSEVQPALAANVSSAAELVLRQELASALGALEAVYKSRQWWLGTKMVPLLDRVPR
ncbi:hypothetical protein, partial [Agrobacterium tumefaciens]|uniref:hypothetical protein n=1 Tax=Agrobacterium tumefaciens TaxID=358 RepID=UPI003BA2F26A